MPQQLPKVHRSRPRTKRPVVQPAVLREREAAIYVGLSAATLNAARQGKAAGPPFLRLGKSVRYRPEDLDAWLLEHRIGQLTRDAG